MQTETENQFVQKNQPNEMTGGEHLPSLDLAQPAVPVITRTKRKNDADDKIRHGEQNPKIEKNRRHHRAIQKTGSRNTSPNRVRIQYGRNHSINDCPLVVTTRQISD